MNELVFKIDITASGDARAANLAAVAGQKTIHEQVRIPEIAYWTDKLNKLQSDLLTSASQRSGILNGTPNQIIGNATSQSTVNKTIEEFGELLYNILFSGKVGSFYDQFIGGNWDSDIRIRLCIDHAALGHLPWETLYNPKSKQHFAVSPKTPLVRSAQFEELQIAPANEPLSVLGMAPLNKGLSELDSAAEQKKISIALEPLIRQKKAVLTWTRGGTYGELIELLSGPPRGVRSWHIFHFIGHGGFHRSQDGTGEGYIYINSNDEDGDEENMVADRVPWRGVAGWRDRHVRREAGLIRRLQRAARRWDHRSRARLFPVSCIGCAGRPIRHSVRAGSRRRGG